MSRPQTQAAAPPVLQVRDLAITFNTRAGPVRAVSDVNFEIARGETLAIVGESGSGKSVTSLAMLRLLPGAPFCDVSGQVLLSHDGQQTDLVTCSTAEMRGIRGRHASIVFQEPMTSLNPVHTAGTQIAESIRRHMGLGQRAAMERAIELLDLVGIPDPRSRAASFPHEMSGGMRQRVMIALALACDPSLLIADEPTTALDVTIQAQIIELMKEIQARTDLAIIFITHNLGVVADVADKVMVMYAGSPVETAPVADLFERPLMPYTRGLLQSVPRITFSASRGQPLPAIRGTVPSPLALPKGCSFGPRCDWFLSGTCDAGTPLLQSVQRGHDVRCHRCETILQESAIQ
ncbi:MAG: ABC transporter ATP-binding protein [Halomonas sp.]|nr:ABC transporter ATP-binding protein [Halomonas sp.]TVP47000.1 MAG: ABC transporter ATP-binding protein [Halomonas sp.]